MVLLISVVRRNSLSASLSHFAYTHLSKLPQHRTLARSGALKPMAELRSPPSPAPGTAHIIKKPRLHNSSEHATSPHTSGPSSTHDDKFMDVDGGNQHVTKNAVRPQDKFAKKNKKKRKPKRPLIEPYSNEDVIFHDVKALLGDDVVSKAREEGLDLESPFEYGQELELVVSTLSSNGESLSVAPAPLPPWVILAPFALPGEKIRVKIYKNVQMWSHGHLLEVIEPNTELRDTSRVQCKYFGKCAGCQFQMLSYGTQLDLKRTVIVKAYQNFSGLPLSAVPNILPTSGSPLEYGYRTKITPHFESPAKKLGKHELPADGSKPDWFKIGFNMAGTRTTMDIEDCPIATPTINEALGPVRDEAFKNVTKYKNGVSLLLRESLELPPDGSANPLPPSDTSIDELASFTEKKICITDHKGTIRERVGDKLFEYTSGSFFQNNNSVLVAFTTYVRDCIFPTSPPPPDSNSSPTKRPTHLVDAYCGSGLFAITLSPYFSQVAGIELSKDSIKSAITSSKLNNLSQQTHYFLDGDASDIFAKVTSFPRDETAVIIDPPRKGSDEKFIDQLIQFGAGVVVYVSCNVHTQARDIGMILRKSREKMGGKEYVLESVRGFDLFPQTAHVESIALLRLVDSPTAAGE